MTVHAHPDDESSKGAGTVALYSAMGYRSVLVCATGGEEGDIINPVMDVDEVRADLAKVRAQELSEATSIIGYTDVEMLGYRDSGMPDSEANSRPEAFWNIDVEESSRKLVSLIRHYRPDVLITYGEDQSRYPHPDHLRVHDISVMAFNYAADPDYHPELGTAHAVSKLYYSLWAAKRVTALHQRFVEVGLESPFTEEVLAREGQDSLITTSIDVGAYIDRRLKALLAHRTQIEPDSKWWFGLDADDQRIAYPYEDFQLARNRIPDYEPVMETDLFAGLP